MDIYDALRQDHDRVKTLLKDLRNTGENDAAAQETLLTALKQELEIHTAFEEEVFYPVVAEQKEAADEIADAIDEHDEAMTILEELEGMGAGTPEWQEQLAMLVDTLDQHIENEELEIFRMAKETIDGERAAQMAKDYQQQKQQRMQASA